MSTETKDDATPWFEIHTNVAALIRYLAETDDIDATDASRIVEKPWHFEEEWARYQVAHAAELAEDAKRFVMPSITLTEKP